MFSCYLVRFVVSVTLSPVGSGRLWQMILTRVNTKFLTPVCQATPSVT
jgi:hypothetical protein